MNLNITLARRAGGVAAQAGKAAAAAATAASTSWRLAKATCLVTLPVAGSKTSRVAPAGAGDGLPCDEVSDGHCGSLRFRAVEEATGEE